MTDDGKYILKSQWMKGIWTLEEFIMPSRMLIVDTVLTSGGLVWLPRKYNPIFSFAKIISEMMEEITMYYDQVIEKRMAQFHGIVAKKDINILCFEPYDDYKFTCKIPSNNNNATNDQEVNQEPIKRFNLPSWTGVN
ncbi:hypothetical protein BDA99DRAFT_556952 [Phascolomyces articulosus]|uniref:Uncharacterized protein n=1 Tax=Phascolomyces articulosus TaxID=60185 RepID=A0AAD5K6K5_9FUNG|nr:hypothetical protein BDA99DRAFT_556952 [Phascolomyces articulosus]